MRSAYHIVILSLCLFFINKSNAQIKVDFSLALPQIDKNIDSLLNGYDVNAPGISKVENDTLNFITKNGTTALVPVEEQEFEMDIEEYVALSFNADQMIVTLDDGYQIVSDKYIPANYNSKTLKEFNGKYYSPELNAYYTFRTEENLLVANHTRLDDFKLNAIKNDYFLGSKGSFLKVVFLRNKSKDVIGFEVSSSRAKNVQFNKIK